MQFPISSTRAKLRGNKAKRLSESAAALIHADITTSPILDFKAEPNESMAG
ncbi:hypothetical protein ES703_29007 [subsurface metagenome]